MGRWISVGRVIIVIVIVIIVIGGVSRFRVSFVAAGLERWNESGVVWLSPC
jgi:hypothetical protein